MHGVDSDESGSDVRTISFVMALARLVFHVATKGKIPFVEILAKIEHDMASDRLREMTFVRLRISSKC